VGIQALRVADTLAGELEADISGAVTTAEDEEFQTVECVVFTQDQVDRFLDLALGIGGSDVDSGFF
jgi:hypothetical protein